MISKNARAVAAYVGSSNVSATALMSAVEWNYRFTPTDEAIALGRLRTEFEALFLHANTQPLTREWIGTYRQRRRAPFGRAEPISVDSATDLTELPKPHEVQAEALAALDAARLAGHRAGLVVLATGLGKTWLAAFDSDSFERVLFVVHREEILQQARDTFRRIRPMSRLGLYTGQEKDGEADVLFASIATLGKPGHLSTFARDRFSYIIIGEFHHAEAASYRRLIDYFEPAFLVGLTATPDRTDGADLLRLCGNHLRIGVTFWRVFAAICSPRFVTSVFPTSWIIAISLGEAGDSTRRCLKQRLLHSVVRKMPLNSGANTDEPGHSHSVCRPDMPLLCLRTSPHEVRDASRSIREPDRLLAARPLRN